MLCVESETHRRRPHLAVPRVNNRRRLLQLQMVGLFERGLFCVIAGQTADDVCLRSLTDLGHTAGVVRRPSIDNSLLTLVRSSVIDLRPETITDVRSSTENGGPG